MRGFSHLSEKTRGILYFMAAMMFFSAMNVLIRSLSGDVPAPQMVFIRNVFSFCMLLPMVARHGIQEAKTTRLGRHFCRALIGLLAMEAWFYSLTQLPVNHATAISFTAPLFTSLFAVIFLGEHIGIRRIIALCCGFGGVLIIANPFDDAHWNHMLLIVLFSAAMISASGIIVKTLTTTEPSWRIVIYMAFFMSILSAPLALAVWETPDIIELSIIFVIAILSTIAQLCLTSAFARAPMVMLMPFDFTRLVFTASFAWILLSEPLTATVILGSGIIVSSAAFIAWRDARLKRLS